MSKDQVSDAGLFKTSPTVFHHDADTIEDSPLKAPSSEAYRLMQPKEGDLICMQSLGRLSLVMDQVPSEPVRAAQLLTNVHCLNGNKGYGQGVAAFSNERHVVNSQLDNVKSVTVKVNCLPDSLQTVDISSTSRRDNDLSAFDPLSATSNNNGFDPWLGKSIKSASELPAHHNSVPFDEFDPLKCSNSGTSPFVPIVPPVKPVAVVDPWVPQHDSGRCFLPAENQEARGFQPITGSSILPGILKTRGSMDDGLPSSLLPPYAGKSSHY